MKLALVFEQGDAVLIAVFLILMLMSVLTWYLIAAKSLLLLQSTRSNKAFLLAFWQAGSYEGARDVAGSHSGSPLAKLALLSFKAVDQYKRAPQLGDFNDYLIRNIRHGIELECSRTAAGMTLLASIGSTAPFIGLFGTVWGIYHALLSLSDAGTATMDMVAGPLGEALVATAAGLAAAIPAVLAYNAFQRSNRVLRERFDGFAHDLHAFLLTESRLPESGQ